MSEFTCHKCGLEYNAEWPTSCPDCYKPTPRTDAMMHGISGAIVGHWRELSEGFEKCIRYSAAACGVDLTGYDNLSDEDFCKLVIGKFCEVGRALTTANERLKEAGDNLFNATEEIYKIESERDSFKAELDRLKLENAWLRRELEKSTKPKKYTGQPDICPCCNWSNGELLNYGKSDQPDWMCHGCATRRLENLEQRLELIVSDADKHQKRADDLTKELEEIRKLARMEDHRRWPSGICVEDCPACRHNAALNSKGAGQ